MSSTAGRILAALHPFRMPLAALIALVTMQKAGDLMVPFFGGRVIDAVASHQPRAAIHALILTAFLFWLCHGSLLPYLIGRCELTGLRYALPRHIGLVNLRRVLGRPPRPDTALQQAVIDKGEQVLVEFTTCLVRVAIPIVVPGIVGLALLLIWAPLLGLIVIVGGGLDLIVTLWLNHVLKPRYTRIQNLDYTRQRCHIRIFRDMPEIAMERRQQARIAEYDAAWTGLAVLGTTTGLRFLGFSLGRSVIVNLTNLATWIAGILYIDAGTYSLGYFLASLSWSTSVLAVLGAVVELQKQWLESIPAIRALFAEIDAPAPPGAEAEAPAPVGAALSPGLEPETAL